MYYRYVNLKLHVYVIVEYRYLELGNPFRYSRKHCSSLRRDTMCIITGYVHVTTTVDPVGIQSYVNVISK